ncbi:MAG TPA: glycosyltransferase, partial [Candidatus Saccharimonadales bacterium]|nr:glycosyltransferase [Candidatus Saccharimonadales bacterium]
MNFNTKQLTIDCISSIEKNYPHEVKAGLFEVIVADNASPDKSLDLFEDYAKKKKIKEFQVVDN